MTVDDRNEPSLTTPPAVRSASRTRRCAQAGPVRETSVDHPRRLTRAPRLARLYDARVDGTTNARGSHGGQTSLPAERRRRWGIKQRGEVGSVDLDDAALAIPEGTVLAHQELLRVLMDRYEVGLASIDEPDLADSRPEPCLRKASSFRRPSPDRRGPRGLQGAVAGFSLHTTTCRNARHALRPSPEPAATCPGLTASVSGRFQDLDDSPDDLFPFARKGPAQRNGSPLNSPRLKSRDRVCDRGIGGHVTAESGVSEARPMAARAAIRYERSAGADFKRASP